MKTWDDVIKAADNALKELSARMNRDPLHGMLYQQMMAIMMLRRMQALAAKEAKR